MFERFTERSRRVVVLAQEEARLLNHNYIGTEHLLLGLIHEEEGVAAQVLGALGIELDVVRRRLAEVVGPGDSSPSGHIPFTPRAKKVLELSLREALQLKHNYIGTEHILLGLIREGEGLAAQLLVELGADLHRVREEVIQTLSGTRQVKFETQSSGGARTPAATKAGWRARQMASRMAAGKRVGSHHLLLALLDDSDSLAGRTLAALGVTKEAAEARIKELGVAGTSDESPEDAGARRMQLRVVGDRLEITTVDPDLVRGLREVVVSGTDPAAARFPELWKAMRETTRDLVRRFEAEPEWQAEGWSDQALAGYVVRVGPDGLAGRLAVTSAEGAEEAEIRALLVSWAEDMQASHPKADKGCASFSVVVEPGDGADSLVLRHLSVGRTPSRKDVARRPLRDLLAFAIDDLRRPA